MKPTPRLIEVRIDELIVDGVDPAARHRLGDAVERHLARLIRAGHGEPVSLLSRETVHAPRVSVDPDATPDAYGASIAEAVYGALRPARER